MADSNGIGVAELKAKLSKHLRAVKRGRSITILQHGHPVARLVPYAGGLSIRKARRDIRDLQFDFTGKGTTHLVEDLIAERKSR